MKRQIHKKKALDVMNYVNIDTGETLASELNIDRNSVVVTEKTNMVTIDYENYVVIESKGLAYICSELNSSDCSRFTQMANWLKTEFNIVFNNNRPHSLDSLSNALGIDKDNTTKLVNRLVKKGLMAYVVCAPSGYVEKLYMLNPSVVRKRKTFNKELMYFFRDYTPYIN